MPPRSPAEIASLVCALALTFASPADAQRGPGTVATPIASSDEPGTTGVREADRDRAREHFVAGVTAYDDGEYDLALREFRRAYAIAPHPSVRLNLANCYLQLRRESEALTLFEAYLVETAAAPTPQRRAVLRRARELRARNATLRVSAGLGGAAPAGLRVRIDGAAVETYGGVAHAPPGERAVVVSADGFPTRRERMDLEPGGERDVVLPMVGGPSGGARRVRARSYEWIRWGVAGFGLGYSVALAVGLVGLGGANRYGSCALGWNVLPVAGPVLATAWRSDCTRRDEAAYWVYAISDAGLQLAGLALVAAGWLTRSARDGGRNPGAPRADWYVLPGAPGAPLGLTLGYMNF